MVKTPESFLVKRMASFCTMCPGFEDLEVALLCNAVYVRLRQGELG